MFLKFVNKILVKAVPNSNLLFSDTKSCLFKISQNLQVSYLDIKKKSNNFFPPTKANNLAEKHVKVGNLSQF